MTGRGAAVQGGLAAVGLIAAYVTWQREPERGAGEAMVLDVTRNELQKVRYQDDTRWIELERRHEKGEPAVWLRTSGIAAPTTPVGGPSHPPVPSIPERELRGNESAGKLLDRFAPMRAARALGALSAPKLKELGLDATKRAIEITARGDKRRFLLGSPAPGGETYLKDERDGRVYLLARVVAGELDPGGTRFIDRSLHAFKLPDVRKVTVAAGGKRRELALLQPESPTPKLASPRTPDKPDELATNWHEKVWRLFPTDVLGKTEVPAKGAPKPTLRVEYAGAGSPLGWIEIGSTAPAPATEPQQGPPAAEVFARTEHTAGWVKLSPSAADLLGEAEKVAGSP